MRAVDLSRLSEQTGGDRRLEREVLGLFAEDARAQVDRLTIADEADRRAIAHRLVGAAGAIGAGKVAHLAAAFEVGQGDIRALADAVEEARQFIAAHLAGPE